MRLARLRDFARRLRRFLEKGPRYHYVYGRWRLRRLLAGFRRPRGEIDDRAFFRRCDLNLPALAAVRAAVRSGNHEAAREELARHLRARHDPKLFFSEEDRRRIVSEIEDADKEETVRAAEEVCLNRFRYRGAAPVRFTDAIDWNHAPDGNTDWRWDFNRHVFFETLGRAYTYTGDERYAEKFTELLRDWLSSNPVGVHELSWSSVFEVGFRINTWIWAFSYFRDARAFDAELCVRLLKGIDAHGRYLNDHLELHARNNHLLLEAKALAILGVCFPELREAAVWRDRGLRIVGDEVNAQVCPDGVHGERATLYHRIIAGQILELLVLLENNGVEPPAGVRERFERMLEFQLVLMKPDGEYPLLADSAVSDTWLRFSATRAGPWFLQRPDLSEHCGPPGEADRWLLGARSPAGASLSGKAGETRRVVTSEAFPEGGYFVMRGGDGRDGTYLVFDCGPFGYPPVPGHGHADVLSFELYAHGETLLVDPGIYSTHLGARWRDFFRGTSAHNTVVVDEQDQSILLGTYHVDRQASAKLHEWMSTANFDYVDGSHDGYERLAEPVTHRRRVFYCKPEYWIVLDMLEGSGEHSFEWFFHLPPGTEVLLDEEKGTHALTSGGAGLWLLPVPSSELEVRVKQGATTPIQGWVSRESGEKDPAPAVSYRLQARAPVALCTLLRPHPPGGEERPGVREVAVRIDGVESDGSQGVRCVSVETETHRDYLLVDSHTREKEFASYVTDASLVFLRVDRESGEVRKVVLRGGSRLRDGAQTLVPGGEGGAVVDAPVVDAPVVDASDLAER